MKDEKWQSPSEKDTFQCSNGHLGISLSPINIVENNLRKLKCSLFSNFQWEEQRPIT